VILVEQAQCLDVIVNKTPLEYVDEPSDEQEPMISMTRPWWTIHTWRLRVTRYDRSTRMTFARLTRQSVVIATLVGLALVSCKHQDPQPAQAPYGYGYPTPYGASYPSAPPPAAPWAPAPASYGPGAQPAITPAFGFYCQSDGDLQCAYGHCINGHCGGCSDVSQCKRGAVCAPSPVGGTCWPDVRPGPGPQPQPQQPTPSQPPPFVPPSSPPGSSDPFAAARQSCVDRINQYRARVRVGPIARDAGSEPCDDDESRLDSSANRAHGSFGKCGERAQNACPNYPGASVEDVLNKCLQQMFDEGPGGGHYDNMTGTKYSRASCGFVSVGGGRIWTVQNFFK